MMPMIIVLCTFVIALYLVRANIIDKKFKSFNSDGYIKCGKYWVTVEDFSNNRCNILGCHKCIFYAKGKSGKWGTVIATKDEPRS